jgi:hypothetical protein
LRLAVGVRSGAALAAKGLPAAVGVLRVVAGRGLEARLAWFFEAEGRIVAGGPWGAPAGATELWAAGVLRVGVLAAGVARWVLASVRAAARRCRG